MSSHIIAHHRVSDRKLLELWASIRPNFSALFVVAMVVFIWTELSPLWLPLASWVISFLEPALLFLWTASAIFVCVALIGFIVAVLGMLIGGTIPTSR